jgi:hypothetical protein
VDFDLRNDGSEDGAKIDNAERAIPPFPALTVKSVITRNHTAPPPDAGADAGAGAGADAGADAGAGAGL